MGGSHRNKITNNKDDYNFLIATNKKNVNNNYINLEISKHWQNQKSLIIFYSIPIWHRHTGAYRSYAARLSPFLSCDHITHMILTQWYNYYFLYLFIYSNFMQKLHKAEVVLFSICLLLKVCFLPSDWSIIENVLNTI